MSSPYDPFYLRDMDSRWVKKLRNGTIGIIAYVVASIACLFILGLVTRPAEINSHWLMPVFNIGTTVLLVWAIWLITTPEPRVAGIKHPAILRRTLRIIAVAQGLALVTVQIIRLVDRVDLSVPVNVLIASVIANAVIYETLLLLWRRYALRLPDQSLANKTSMALYGFSCCGLLVIAGAFMFKYGIMPGPALAVISGFEYIAPVGLMMVCGGLMILLGILLWSFSLAFAYTRALHLAYTNAQMRERQQT